MRAKGLLRLLAASVIADGLFLLIRGRDYARWWNFPTNPGMVRRAVMGFSGLPSWLIRLLGLGEAAVGLGVLTRVPVDVGELYNLLAPGYDRVSAVWRWQLYPDIHRAFDGALAEYLPEGGSVLDLGCGTAANLGRLHALNLPFGAYVGVDQSESMLAQSEARFSDVQRASFRRLNLMTDPLPDGPFDLVVSTWVFSHLPYPARVVEKAMAKLREGGHMVLLFIGRPEGPGAGPLASSLAFFSTHPVSERTYLAFPGPVHLKRFSGGALVLMVLRH